MEDLAVQYSKQVQSGSQASNSGLLQPAASNHVSGSELLSMLVHVAEAQYILTQQQSTAAGPNNASSALDTAATAQAAPVRPQHPQHQTRKLQQAKRQEWWLQRQSQQLPAASKQPHISADWLATFVELVQPALLEADLQQLLQLPQCLRAAQVSNGALALSTPVAIRHVVQLLACMCSSHAGCFAHPLHFHACHVVACGKK
jgi:hypothetical protein